MMPLHSLFQFHHRQRGCGPVILFLHGFMGSDRDFDPVVARLAHRYTCLTLDLPDHGQTQLTADRPYALSLVATGLLHWLTAITDEPCRLVGYSMGGRLALYMALAAPAKFSALVLESASPGLKTPAERQARIALDEERAVQLQQDFQAFLHQWYRAPMFRNLSRQPNFDATLQRRRQNSPKALARSLRCIGTGRQPSLWPHLSTLTLPTLLITGQHDPKFCAISAEMAQHLPNAQRVTVPNCGHTVHLEDPTQYCQALERWLN